MTKEQKGIVIPLELLESININETNEAYEEFDEIDLELSIDESSNEPIEDEGTSDDWRHQWDDLLYNNTPTSVRREYTIEDFHVDDDDEPIKSEDESSKV